MVVDPDSDSVRHPEALSGRLADAVRSTAAAIVLLGRGDRIDFANEAAVRLLGRAASDLQGRRIDEVLRPTAAPPVASRLLAALETTSEWAGEVAAVRPGGQRIPCLATLSSVLRAEGGTHGFVLTLRDISERVALEETLRAANRRLAEEASHDHLTGLYNRAFLREVLDREVAQAARGEAPLTVLMVDLDRFKRVNDASGHELGDLVLQQVAKVLPPAVRDGDVVARWGGDEFCILLPNADARAGRDVADRVRAHVREAGYGPRGDIRLTASAGLATSPHPGDGTRLAPLDLLRRADRALLEAKRDGGDRVVLADPAG